MEDLVLEFKETGGYDCMYGAWVIRRSNERILTIDQGDFGQPSCQYDFRSTEAREIAETCFRALGGNA
jgi:hypothetical protein